MEAGTGRTMDECADTNQRECAQQNPLPLAQLARDLAQTVLKIERSTEHEHGGQESREEE